MIWPHYRSIRHEAPFVEPSQFLSLSPSETTTTLVRVMCQGLPQRQNHILGMKINLFSGYKSINIYATDNIKTNNQCFDIKLYYKNYT
jgi:hypothetical protein